MSGITWRFSRNPELKNSEVIVIDKPAAAQAVAVVGAGPAGLFAAKQLAAAGVRVALINRDIKPGGLAEYGIYPDKIRMKTGLRQQFHNVLALPQVEYFGNLSIHAHGEISLEDLRAMGFQAILVTVGAQGTKWLGLPGEDLTGVYHAKDIVYHYNHLPGYSEQQFHIGRRVAVIGMGNVMLDIAHWLIYERQVDEVIALARRGPAEVKFTRAELEYVIHNLDQAALETELQRIAPILQGSGQSDQALRDLVTAVVQHANPPARVTHSRFRLSFLQSPVRIVDNGQGQVGGLEVEHNTLQVAADGARARGTGQYSVVPVDTVIFAIGDRVDDSIGLPLEGNEFVKNQQPAFPIEGISYEVYDPVAQRPIPDVFVAGWARQASTGLVGVARKDGTNASQAVLQYLQTLPPANEDAIAALHARAAELPKPVISTEDLGRLEQIEKDRAAQTGLVEFKFETNQEMLAALGYAYPIDQSR